MTSDESIMIEMLDRATNPSKERVDELGVQMFCIIVRTNYQLVHKAQEMIVTKVRSSNVTEATRAIALLEECMTQCGDNFQDEAAKFRFLNELIRLVSKKYQGAETAHQIKQRIMECLLLWTTEFPQRQKIRDAYDMLRKEGDIDHGQTTAALAKRESVLSTIDEAMFAKLIKSKDPENLKRANLLVQYRMAQEARRNDLLVQHRLELQEVRDTMQLLNQMLDTYNPGDNDVNETMHELYKSCKRHKPIFQHLPELLGDSEAQLIDDTLETNSALLTIMARYKQLVPSPTVGTTSARSVSGTATTTLTSTSGSATEIALSGTKNGVLLNELLGDLLIVESGAAATSSTNANTSNNFKVNAFEDLSEIFNSALAESDKKQQTNSTKWFQELGSGELLEPQVLSLRRKSNSDGGDSLPNGNAAGDSKTNTARKMPEIDMLSDELFQQILPIQERLSSFKRDPEKLTLNDMARERTKVKTVEKPAESLDDVPLLSALPAQPTPAAAIREDVELVTEEPQPQSEISEPSKHLIEISIELDNIQATGEERVLLDDDDMHLRLNFTEERPSRHVSVIVILVQNKNRQPVKDFHFDASVKKPCKVRLLSPTDIVMAAHKPFRPAALINQVMLLFNPTGKPVDVTCIIDYKLGDDPDPIKESIVAKAIAYVE